MITGKRRLGDFGEDAAAKYLKKKRYKILCRNYSNKYGEIDIIAKYKRDIIFVEVKTRPDSVFGTPAEAVTYTKRQKIFKCAKWYMAENNIDRGARFDVIEVYAELVGEKYKLKEINHIEGAFEVNDTYL